MISSNLRNPAAKLSWLLCVGLMCLLFNSAYANTAPAATVLFSQGTVTLSNAKISHDLTKGSTIQAGDTITTGNNGRVQLRFSDGGMMALVPNSEFAVDEYLQPSANDEGKAHFNLVKGGLRTISGSIGKKSPDSYQLKTRVATLGIRGTEFLVTMSGDQMGVHVGEGRVSLANDMGQLLVSVGQSAVVMMGEAPQLSSQPVTLAAASSTNAAAEDDEENDTNSTQNTTADNSATTGTDNSLTANLSAIDKITYPEVRKNLDDILGNGEPSQPTPPTEPDLPVYGVNPTEFYLMKMGFDGVEDYHAAFDANASDEYGIEGSFFPDETQTGASSLDLKLNFNDENIRGVQFVYDSSVASGIGVEKEVAEKDRLIWGVWRNENPKGRQSLSSYTPFVLGNPTQDLPMQGELKFSLNKWSDAWLIGTANGNFSNSNGGSKIYELEKFDLTIAFGQSTEFSVNMLINNVNDANAPAIAFESNNMPGEWNNAQFNVELNQANNCQNCNLILGGMVTGESAQAAGVVFQFQQGMSQSDPQFIGSAKLGRKP